MSEEGAIEIVHKNKVAVPLPVKSIPVSRAEWCRLKTKLSKLGSEPWFFRSLAMLLFGSALTTLIWIFLGRFSSPENHEVYQIAWAVVVAAAFSGGLCLAIVRKERSIRRERADDILDLMEFIESKFPKDGRMD